MIVGYDKKTDISKRPLFSLYFSMNSTVNLLFSGLSTHIASHFTQNPH